MQNFYLLFDSDRQIRLNFSYYCKKYPEGYTNLLSKIVFTDECMFRLNVDLNTENVQIWGQRGFLNILKYQFTVHRVLGWHSSSKEKIIGHFSVEGRTVALIHANSCRREKFSLLWGVSNENTSPRRMEPSHADNLHYVLVWTENATITGLEGKAW